MMNRRSFFKKSALAGVAALAIPEIVKAAMPETKSLNETARHSLSKGDVILFQGDSITDGGRDKNKEVDANQPKQLGGGYVLYTSASILAGYADKELKIYNRGISGNKVFQLAERWNKDCIDLKPNILSILIGVNDFWHTKTNGYAGTIVEYETDYRNLIAGTLKALPGVRIVICEPFIIHGGTALDDTWERDFAPYRETAKALAKSYGLTFVPFQSLFNEALKKAGAAYWGADGVHPSMAGAQLMAQAWMKAVL
ncbi:MAG: SGNH/GDSL hydrolase family protein [Dysgonamonadaceae bacterium]|jgi:lysophospholipase L1-like esterase|nr:SGNH/GDSL hydrolase family protein [Dysgonamonadaceae bacterium]